MILISTKYCDGLLTLQSNCIVICLNVRTNSKDYRNFLTNCNDYSNLRTNGNYCQTTYKL